MKNKLQNDSQFNDSVAKLKKDLDYVNEQHNLDRISFKGWHYECYELLSRFCNLYNATSYAKTEIYKEYYRKFWDLGSL